MEDIVLGVLVGCVVAAVVCSTIAFAVATWRMLSDF